MRLQTPPTSGPHCSFRVGSQAVLPGNGPVTYTLRTDGTVENLLRQRVLGHDRLGRRTRLKRTADRRQAASPDHRHATMRLPSTEPFTRCRAGLTLSCVRYARIRITDRRAAPC